MNIRLFFSTIALLISAMTGFGQQLADPEFSTAVANPAYNKNSPRVLFDEAHNNFHTTSGRYKPFADLMFSDGYQIAANRKSFTRESLQSYKILVIADHAPFGSAAEVLARRFEVQMSKGFVSDPEHSSPGNATLLLFSRENK